MYDTNANNKTDRQTDIVSIMVKYIEKYRKTFLHFISVIFLSRYGEGFEQ